MSNRRTSIFRSSAALWTALLFLALEPVPAAAQSGSPFVLPEPAGAWFMWILGLLIVIGIGGGLGFFAGAICILMANKVFGDGDDEAVWASSNDDNIVMRVAFLFVPTSILAGAAAAVGVYVYLT